MGEVDDLTREKLRDWQLRRLQIKDQMQDHPERTLELSRVLDLMDDEHAEILAAATIKTADAREPAAVQEPLGPRFGLQLQATAQSPQDLRKLLELALYEVQAQIDRAALVASENRSYPGSMAGTLGDYHFELRVNDERAANPVLNEVAHLAGRFSSPAVSEPAACDPATQQKYDQD